MTKQYPKDKVDWQNMKAHVDEDNLIIGGWQVMQSWELPIMKLMAEVVAWNHGDVLEIGFGLGIAATEIVKQGCNSYTVIEAHPTVVDLAKEWSKSNFPNATIINGFWEEEIKKIDQRFDGILFDTYPLSHNERSKNHYPFIKVARNLLKPNGVLTYYSDETRKFRQDHLDLILQHFDDVSLITVNSLQPPVDCEYWQHDHMVIPVLKHRTIGNDLKANKDDNHI